MNQPRFNEGNTATEQPPATDQPPDTPLPYPNDMMNLFRSLGDDCEFGVVQRHAGADPIDLLRFAAVHVPHHQRIHALTDAILQGFEGLGETETLTCELNPALDQGKREFSIRESKYHLGYHTFRFEDEISPERLCQEQAQILRFWRRKFLDDLRAADKVCVWKSGVTHTEADVRSLLAATRKHGPNTLLRVDPASPNGPTGIVEDLGDGLFKGSISRIARFDHGPDVDYESWYDLCDAAYLTIPMFRQLQLAAAQQPAPAESYYLGSVECVIDDKLCGWCWRIGDPAPVWLALYVDGQRLARFRANEKRDIREHPEIGDGRHGFFVALPLQTLAPGAVISVRTMRSAIEVPNSGRALSDYLRL
jgi:hypothetical protein